MESLVGVVGRKCEASMSMSCGASFMKCLIVESDNQRPKSITKWNTPRIGSRVSALSSFSSDRPEQALNNQTRMHRSMDTN